MQGDLVTEDLHDVAVSVGGWSGYCIIRGSKEKRSANVLAVGNETDDKHGGAGHQHPDGHVGFLASYLPCRPGVIDHGPRADSVRQIVGAVSEGCEEEREDGQPLSPCLPTRRSDVQLTQAVSTCTKE